MPSSWRMASCSPPASASGARGSTHWGPLDTCTTPSPWWTSTPPTESCSLSMTQTQTSYICAVSCFIGLQRLGIYLVHSLSSLVTTTYICGIFWFVLIWSASISNHNSNLVKVQDYCLHIKTWKKRRKKHFLYKKVCRTYANI